MSFCYPLARMVSYSTMHCCRPNNNAQIWANVLEIGNAGKEVQVVCFPHNEIKVITLMLYA